jgi:hypothetical protein
MPDVADYRVISDSGVTIQTGGDIDRDFNFNLGTAVQHGQDSVLQFFMVSGSNANNLSFQFAINGTPVRTINVTGNHFASIHEVARSTRDNDNRLSVRITGGSGSVTLADIVLWVQRSV